MLGKRCLLLLCLGLTACGQMTPPTGKPPASPPAATAPPLDRKSALEVVPKSLYEAYLDNNGDEGRQYTDKTIKIEGVVKTVGAEDGQPCIHLYVPASDGGATIRCAFDPARQADMEDVKGGGEVTILGRCVGPRNNVVTLENCVVLRYRPGKNS